MKESIPEQAANIVLGKAGEGERFTVISWPFKLRLQIRPITSENVVRIGKEVSKMKEIKESTMYFPGIWEHATDSKHIWRSIAIASLYKTWKIVLFKRIVSLMIGKAEHENLQRLWNIIEMQVDAQRFFFIMASAKGLNKLEMKKQKEEIAGSDKLP